MVPRQTKSRLPNRVATARCRRTWLKARSTVLRFLQAARSPSTRPARVRGRPPPGRPMASRPVSGLKASESSRTAVASTATAHSGAP
jgi:hypothetical protein